MISLLLIFFAAFFNSCMDKVENEIQFYSSAFKTKNKYFFCKTLSAKSPFIPFTKSHFDFWHLCKSAMIFCLCGAIVCYKITTVPFLDFIILGLAWNGTFNLFYNKILKR